jgi:dihydroorotate dehydrogenase (NAD+) catalytic subunit
MVDLSVYIGRIKLANPVIAASGTFGYGLEYRDFLDLNRLGAFCTKGLSLRPRIGNKGPRVMETSSGMLNSIGLENIGFERFVSEKMPILHSYTTKILVNFFGETIEEYVEMAKVLSDVERIDGLEMNVSCPNVSEGGTYFSSQPNVLCEVVSAVRKVTEKLLIVKLSPNVGDIGAIAQAAEEAGADAVSLINTLTGISYDLETRKPYLGNETGGLSGPAIKPIALRMVREVSRAVSIPIIGIGGIRSTEDALEFLLAGANAVQIGTANFFDPTITVKIIDGLERYFLKNGIERIADFKSS